MNWKKTMHATWLIALLLAPFVLWALPVDTFNDTGVLTCPSQRFLGIECLGCGITRAVMHFHHLQFTEAVFYNYLVIGVYPFLIWLWQLWVRAELKYFNIWPKKNFTDSDEVTSS